MRWRRVSAWLGKELQELSHGMEVVFNAMSCEVLKMYAMVLSLACWSVLGENCGLWVRV